MPISNIVCSICADVFRSSSEVISTDCGHLFHYDCFNGWINNRNRCCPHCRRANPVYHELRLSFTESEEDKNTNKEEINLQIKISEGKIGELLRHNQELENKFLKLEVQYSLAQSINTELERKLSLMNKTEDDFLRLQAQYTDIAEIRKQFEDRLNQLFIENECKIKELQQRTDENEQLKSSLDGENFALPNNASGDKLRIIEQKLKFATEELQKEINISSLLSIDNMKLQSYINHHSAENKENETKNHKSPDSRHDNVGQKRLPSCPELDGYVNSVVIKGLPLSEIDCGSLKNAVINLGFTKNLILSSDDFIKIDVMNRDLEKIIFVQFKELEKKLEFLYNSETFQIGVNTTSVSVENFMSDDLRELFIYTRKMLYDRGLAYICIENNNIVAKKSRMHPGFVCILNKQQVDRIARFLDSKR